MLTVKRTMTCFFAIIFSVPFFISTTYKAWLSEFVPIANMIDTVKDDHVAYMATLQFIVDHQNDKFDKLVRLKADGFLYEDQDFADDKIRQLDLIEIKEKGIIFTVYLRNTVRLYAI